MTNQNDPMATQQTDPAPASEYGGAAGGGRGENSQPQFEADSAPAAEQWQADPAAAPAPDAARSSGREPTESGFDALIENYLDQVKTHPAGALINARVVAIKNDYIMLDIGEKAEGVVSTSEFTDAQGRINLAVGAEIPVLLQERDEENGQVTVSHVQARERVNWKKILAAFSRGEPLRGTIIRAVNQGVMVDVGAEAFMPASQIGLKPVGDLASVVGQEVEVRILELNRKARKLVVSGRAVLEERRRRAEEELLRTLQPGDERTVMIKRIVEFGAFADMGGADGLIPRSEISWAKNVNPADHLSVGQEVRVKVLSVDPEQKKIALSRRLLHPDPWERVAEKYPVGQAVTGKIVHVTPFEAFVELEEGVSGRIHHSELSWARGRAKVAEQLKVGDPVRCVVLELDSAKRRLALGVKQLDANPWEEIRKELHVGSKINGTVTALAKFGAFVRINECIEGLVHISELSWDKNISHPSQLLKVGDEVEAQVLSIDVEKERIGLGIKQLESNPFELFTRRHKKGAAVEGRVTQLMDFRAIVELAPGVEGSIHVSQLSDERVEKPSDLLKPGETVQALIVKIDPKKQRIELSRRDWLKSDEKARIKEIISQNQGSVQSFKELLADVKLEADPDSR